MRASSERVFFVGLAVLMLTLAAVGAGLGGRERPLLVLLIVAAVLILWVLTRRGSRPPAGWRKRGVDRGEPPP